MAGLAGGGVIAIIELGGGWVQSDMNQFFGEVGQPVPQITDVPVDGTQNTPDPDPNGPDGEVALGLAHVIRRDRKVNGPHVLKLHSGASWRSPPRCRPRSATHARAA